MKESEIFNGMQFGDRFLTRDGRHAVFTHSYGNPTECLFFFVKGFGLQEVLPDGRLKKEAEHSRDIVRRCKSDGWEPDEKL